MRSPGPFFVFFVTLLLFFATACSSGAESSEGDTVPLVGDSFTISYEMNPAAPTVGSNYLVVTLTDAEGTPLEGAGLDVQALMEAHGHGTTEDPQITELGDGVYDVEVVFQMPGEWTVDFMVVHGQESETLSMDIAVE